MRIDSLAAAVLAWQLLTANDVRIWARFDQLPTVGEIVGNLAKQLGRPEYYQDLTSSLGRILTGFVLAAVFGVCAGILIARSKVAADLLKPLFEVVRPIPAIALVPIAILVFPSNEQGIVFITFVAAFFPIVVSTRHAAHALPTVWEEAVRTMDGGRLRVLWHVVLPGTLPGVPSVHERVRDIVDMAFCRR